MVNFIVGLGAVVALVVVSAMAFFFISLIVYIGTRVIFYFLIDAFPDAKEKVLSDRLEGEKFEGLIS